MIVLSGALVLVALVLLVFGAVDRNLPYVYASIGVSVLSLLLLLVGILQRRGELTGDEQATRVTDTSDERVPALVGADQEQGRAALGQGDAVTSELALPTAPAQPEPARPASRRVAPVVVDAPEAPEALEGRDVGDEPVDDELEDQLEDHELVEDELEADGFEDDELEDDDFEDDEREDAGSGVTVLVVSGRPRYHLEGCRVLRGKEPQPLDRDDARTHGFSPCGVCKPDADESAPQAVQGTPVPAAQEQAEDDEPQATDDQPQATEDGEPPPAEDGEPQRSEGGPSFTEALFGAPLFADAPADGAGLPDRPVAQADQDEDVEPVAPASRRRPPVAERAVPADDVPPPTELHGDDPADDVTAAEAPAGDDAVRAEPSPDAAGPDDPDEQPPADEAAPRAPVDLPAEEPAAQPVDEEPVDQEPVVEEPVVEPVAAEDVPVDGTTSASDAAPVTDPVDDEVGEPAAASAPAEPVRRQPAKRAPAKKAPVEKAPAKKAPVKRAPAEKAPADEAPAKKAPRKKAPAKKAAEQAPTAPAAAPAPAPTVKRPLVRAVRPDALRLGAPSAGGASTRVSARAAAPATAPPVVVVPDRDRFHRPDCRYVRGVAGATTLPKASASRQGYAACGVCKP